MTQVPATGPARAQLQALLKQGLDLHLQGRLAEAKTIYEAVLKKDPKSFDALHLLGTLAVQARDFETAVEVLGKAIKLNPNVAEAYSNRGTALQELKQLKQALRDFDKALALKPDYVEIHYNRGNTLRGLKRPAEAVASYDKALALRPNYAEAYNNRGSALLDLKQPEEALACFETALARQPNYPEAHTNRGNALLDLKRPDEALASYDRALTLKPGHAETHNNRGNALVELKRSREALDSYDRALALRPDYTNAHNSRAHALENLGRLTEAMASYETILALEPDYPFLLGNILILRMGTCDWRGLAENLETLKAGIRAAKKIVLPFPLLALIDDPRMHRRATEIYVDSELPRTSALGAIAKRARRERIRIGYYSADFHNHATAYLMAELLEAHDASRFEIFGFSFGPDRDDEMRKRLSAAIGQFFDVRKAGDRDIARHSRKLGIDIAVDLKGYTQDSRPGIFAERCAPVQVSYLGYPGTTAAPCIDYVVADETVLPQDRQGDFTERAIYLPRSYQVNDSQRKISDRAFARNELGLPDKGFVFCCFNSGYKILPRIFDIWMRLLKSVDGSVLWLLEGNATAAANLRREAEARGVEAGRLVFGANMPLDEHLARQRLADLFLDTLPCNAHTTASDALWAGLPIVTCMGKSFASRVAASLLRAIELPELVTMSLEEYEAKALDLAMNASKLETIKRKLDANRLSAPLFDTKLFARHIESAYATIYERYQAGLPPESFKVP